MDLKIRQTWPQIRLRTTSPELRLQVTESQLNIRQRNAQVRCDATQCREEIGLRSPVSFARDNAHKGYETVMQHIGQVARNGDMMAQIDRYDMSAVVTALSAQTLELPRFILARVPNSPVDMDVLPAELKIDYRVGEVISQPIRGEISLYMQPQGSVETEYVGRNVDIRG
ncbi:MAG: DUF6470 family protein [Clostridia bacterium]|jgi:hypothetical protein|nr:DUF6470 family protein [Clostridia bacterium]